MTQVPWKSKQTNKITKKNKHWFSFFTHPFLKIKMSGTFPSLHSATLGSFSACETLWTVLYVLSLDDILTQFNLQMQKRGWVVAEPWLNAYTLAFCLLRYTESSWQGGSPFIKNLTPPADRGWNEALVSIQAPKACFKLDAVKKNVLHLKFPSRGLLSKVLLVC